jgi:hypothetical protein
MDNGSERMTTIPSSPARGPATGRRSLCIGGLALVAAGLVLWATRDGASTSADSAVYVGTAQSVAAGHGLNVPFHYYPLGGVNIGTPPTGQTAPTPTPLVIYAPLAPVLLAIGGHPFAAARIEDTIFFALTVLLVGIFVLAVTDELWLAAAAQGVVAFSLAVFASDVGTISAALFFTTLAIMAVLRDREAPRPVWLIVAAVAIGLATLERYAAGGLIVWGALALRHRRGHAAALLVMSSCPLAAWFVYEQVSGRSTGHFVGFHIVKTTIRTGIRSVADWILPTNSPFPIAVLGAFVVAIVVALLLRQRVIARLVVLFIVVQIVILEIATTFFDAGVNLDSIEFIPLFLALVIGVACSVKPRQSIQIITIAVVVASVVRFGVDTTTHPTLGYSTAAWVHSPIMADVRALPPDAVIYTNAPDAIYLLDHRSTSSLPERVDFSTLKENPLFNSQLGEIRRTLTTRGGFVVFVRGLGRGSFLPSESSLKRELSLLLVRNAHDGAVYRLPPP